MSIERDATPATPAARTQATTTAAAPATSTAVAPATSTGAAPTHTRPHDGHVGSIGEAMSAISRRIVALLKEYNGKGPVKIRTYHWNDLLVVLMTGGYTTVETTLLREGRADAVRAQRAAFQQVMVPRFTKVIEQELGREVVACMQSNHHEPDYTAELFVLAPRGDARPAPSDHTDPSRDGART